MTEINLLFRLAQLREMGVQFRIRQQYITSTQSDTEPSSIDVSSVTVAPILVLLAAGNVIGLLVLLIEQCLHGDFRTRRPGNFRRPQNKGYRRNLHEYRLVESHYM